MKYSVEQTADECHLPVQDSFMPKLATNPNIKL